MPRTTISCAGTRVISSPANLIVPELAGVRPEIDRSVVDFPAPFDADQGDHLALLDRQRDALERLGSSRT